jgi:hypothetical protein
MILLRFFNEKNILVLLVIRKHKHQKIAQDRYFTGTAEKMLPP